jgi:hypothetical protein
MPSAPEAQKNSRLRPLVFVGVAAIAGVATSFLLKPKQGNGSVGSLEALPTTGVVANGELSAGAQAPTETDSLQSSDEQALLKSLREKLATSRDDVLAALAEIAKTRPALAIDLAQSLGRTPEEKSQWVTNLTQQWAEQSPQAAWDWLKALPGKRMQELGDGDLAPVVLGAMAAKDPKMVLANVDTLLRSGNPSEAVSTSVAVHFGLDALVANGQTDLAKQAVDGWAKDPAKLNLEAAAYESVAMALAEKEPAATAEWLQSLPKNEERNAAFATMAAVWGDKDPAAALKWAEQLPPNEGRSEAIGRAVSDLAEKYPNEITTWVGDYLAKAPPGPESDSLVARVINYSSAAKKNPQVALQWLDLINDPQQRIQQEETVSLRWARKDKNAALTHVQNSPTFSPQQKATLIQRIQSNDLPETLDE